MLRARTLALALAPGLVLASACTYNELSRRGSLVSTVPSAPGPECQNLGTVFGKGGGGFGGFVPNESLMQFAINDARNRAAELGATDLVVSPPQLGVAGSQYGTSTTSATVMAIAYRCPGAAALASAPEPAAPAAAPAPAPAAPKAPPAVSAGFRPTLVRARTPVRTGPAEAAPVTGWLEPSSETLASDEEVTGYRRVKSRDGTLAGFVRSTDLSM